jgi:hypothetical protein
VVTAQVKEEEPQPDEPEEDSVQPGENSGENEHAGQTEAEQNNVFQNVMTGDAESVFTILLLLAGSGIVLLANRIGRLFPVFGLKSEGPAFLVPRKML